MTWNTKSGYGFTLLGQVKIKYNNYDNVRSGAITFAQNANVLFPEFAYTTLYHNDAREYITYNKSDVLTQKRI